MKAKKQIKRTSKPKSTVFCQVCGEELTQKEIEHGEGWCNSCNDPGRGDYWL